MERTCQVCKKPVISGIKICIDCQCKLLQAGKKIEKKSDYVPSWLNKLWQWKVANFERK